MQGPQISKHPQIGQNPHINQALQGSAGGLKIKNFIEEMNIAGYAAP